MRRVLKIGTLIALFAIIVLAISACNTTSVSFKVSFSVDGKIVKTIDTNGREVISLPSNPEKDGFIFDGWYWDVDTWQRPFTANSLLDEPLSEDMTVYAKWKSEEGEEQKESISLTSFEKTGDKSFQITLSNATENLHLTQYVIVPAGASWILATDISAINMIPSKVVTLAVGDNIYYVLVTPAEGEPELYTLNLYRKHLYTVSFNTNGGTYVENQIIEEGALAIEPVSTRLGYTFAKWSYDFSNPIMKQERITAEWTANENTTYKVEYYLENLQDNNYTLAETANLMGTTDSQSEAEIKEFPHYVLNQSKSEVKSIIAGNGSLVQHIYYNVERFSVNIDIDKNGYCSNRIQGDYKYGESIKVTPNLLVYAGCEFSAWYLNDELLTSEEDIEIDFVVDKDVSYIAKCKAKEEMRVFNFSSTQYGCNIYGISDDTLTDVIIPNYVTRISFRDCSTIKNVLFEEGSTLLSIDSSAFANCTSLISIELPNSVTLIEAGAFAGCSSLESIKIPFLGSSKSATSPSSTTLLGVLFGSSSYVGGTAVKQYYRGSYESNTEYSTYYIPSSLRRVSVTGGDIMRGAFYNCSMLTSVTIEEGVGSIGSYAFYNCTGLTSISIPFGVPTISYSAFRGCSGLTSISIPLSVTSIEKSAFKGCSRLTSISIPSSVISIGNSILSGCSSLRSLTIPFVGSIEKKAASNVNQYPFGYLFGTDSYSGATAVQQSSYSSSTHAWTSTTYYIPSLLRSVTVTRGYSQYRDFLNCSMLTSITFGEGVSNIGDSAFYNCTGLTSITIPTSVTSIEWSALYGCNRLTSITFLGTKKQWNAISKASNWNTNTGKYTIHCEDGDLAK